MSDPFASGAPPASVRNAPAIQEILSRVWAPLIANGGAVLEAASGSGYHAYTFAKAFPKLAWQSTDGDAESCRNLARVMATAALPNLKPPLQLDVSAAAWPVTSTDAMLCINMIHISPWAATLDLFKGAARILAPGSTLVTYGPYSLNGDFLAESNVAFDQSLRTRNPDWGLREVTDVAGAASEHGFTHAETLRMPANNLMLVFTLRG